MLACLINLWSDLFSRKYGLSRLYVVLYGIWLAEKISVNPCNLLIPVIGAEQFLCLLLWFLRKNEVKIGYGCIYSSILLLLRLFSSITTVLTFKSLETFIIDYFENFLWRFPDFFNWSYRLIRLIFILFNLRFDLL